MNIKSISSNGNVFADIENIDGCSFKNAVLRDSCVFLLVDCSKFALLRDSYAHFNRDECLSPNNCTA